MKNRFISNDVIIAKIANEKNLKISDVRKIVDSQFKSVKNCMENLENIRLPRFGTFAVSSSLKKRVETRKERKNAQQETNS